MGDVVVWRAASEAPPPSMRALHVRYAMNRHLRAVLILAFGFSAAGPSCGGSSDEPEDMSPTSVCAFYAERNCASFERCYPSVIKGSYNDMATCRDRMARSCELRLTATGTNETAD